MLINGEDINYDPSIWRMTQSVKDKTKQNLKEFRTGQIESILKGLVVIRGNVV